MNYAVLDERITRILADPAPGLKMASDFPELRRQITILLDGDDVTARCKAFSVPDRTVELYAEDERGRKVVIASCACGALTRKEKVAASGMAPVCRVCLNKYEWSVLTVTRMGDVEVVRRPGVEIELSPADYFAEFRESPLRVRLSRFWFMLRLWGPLLGAAPLYEWREVLPLLFGRRRKIRWEAP